MHDRSKCPPCLRIERSCMVVVKEKSGQRVCKYLLEPSESDCTDCMRRFKRRLMKIIEEA